MGKNFVLSLMLLSSFFFMGCTKKNAQYYRMNPGEISNALTHCSEKEGRVPSCNTLLRIQESVNQRATALSIDPQGFGKQILALEEKIATIQLALKNNPRQESMIQELSFLKEQLESYLAIVRWREAPER